MKRKILLYVLPFLMFCLLFTPSARAQEVAGEPESEYQGLTIVHWEEVQAGPYTIALGFSEWPILAERSLDIVFLPDDGIAEKQGTVTLISPTGEEMLKELQRHPRMYEAWGLDIIALPASGPWTFLFEIEGPQGPGVGHFAPVMLLERPGPPIQLGWAIGLLPLFGMLVLVGFTWRKVRPARFSQVWEWF